MSKARVLLVILTLVAAGGAVAAARTKAVRKLGVENSVPTYEVHQVPFARRVIADGFLRAVKSDPVVSPQSDGPVKLAWMVADGSAVKQGDILIRFDPTELEQRKKDGQSDRATAVAKIEKERTATGALVRDRERTARLSEAELEKIKKFQSKDSLIFSRNQIIESAVDAELSAEKKTHAERVETLEGALSKSKIDLLRVDERKAQIAIGIAEKGLSSMEVRAPHDGVIVFDPDWLGVLPKVGDTVWSGEEIANLPLLDAMEAEVFVLEADAGGLAKGVTATLILEAHPGTVYKGTIKEIDNLAKPRVKDVPINYFSVVLSLERTDKDRMRPGQRAHATLLLDEQEALAVPRQAVFEKEGRQVVYVGDNFEERVVKLGPSSPGLVVIESGLTKGDVIALRDPTRPALPASQDTTATPAKAGN